MRIRRTVYYFIPVHTSDKNTSRKPHAAVTNDEYALRALHSTPVATYSKTKNNRNSMSTKIKAPLRDPEIRFPLQNCNSVDPTGVATAIHGNAAVGGGAEVPKLTQCGWQIIHGRQAC